MDYHLRPPYTAYELLLIDAELVHLQRVVPLEVAASNPVLPLLYWQRRVTRILAARHPLPAQLAVASALLDVIESANTGDRLLAKAS